MLACAAELSQMVAQGKGGVIINVGSSTGLTGSAGTPAYVTSKHAVNGLTRAIAIDYAPFGIRCNSVNMGATDTPMLERANGIHLVAPKWGRAQQAARHGQGRTTHCAHLHNVVAGGSNLVRRFARGQLHDRRPDSLGWRLDDILFQKPGDRVTQSTS